MKKFISKLNSDKIAACLIVFFVLVFCFLSFGRHASLKSYLNDLGTYDQVVWQTLHGNFFANSANMLNIPNYLGAHFSPILVLFVPFYAIYASPEWLLFFQVLAVGASAIPIYLFAKEKLSSSAALVILSSYLLYPILHNGLLYDFHEVVFATVFASFAFYFLEKGRDGWFIFFSILLALSQEHLALLVFMMGLYLIFIKKKKKLGAAVSALSLAYFFLVVIVVMPHFSGTGNPALLANSSPYASRYSWLGGSLQEIAKNIFSHPLKITLVIFSPERVKYLFFLVAPVFSLCLFSWPIALITPLVLINLLSSNAMTYDVFFYHSAIFAPFVFFSAILTLERWFWDSIPLRSLFLALVLAASIISSILLGVSPLSPAYKVSDFIPDAHANKISDLKKIIPLDASLSIQDNLGPHFSERENIWRFPLKKNESDFILLDQTDPYRSNPKQFFQFDYALQILPDEWKSDIEDLKQSANFDLIYSNDGYLLFRRKTS